MSTPVQNRDAAIARVDEHARPEWKDYADVAVASVARSHRTFTSDDVWERLVLLYPHATTHDPRAMGPVLMRAVRRQVARLRSCDHCGTRKVMVMSRRPQANAMDTPVYESLIHGQPAPPDPYPASADEETLF